MNLTSRATVGLFSLLSAGCSSGTIVTGDSPFASGVYSGQNMCEGTLEVGGAVIDSYSVTTDAVVTIAGSGLPVYEGREVVTGLDSSITIGELTVALEVTALSIASNGITVESDAIISEAGSNAVLVGVYVDTYLAGPNGTIENQSEMVLGATTPDGSLAILQQECDLVLRK